MHYLANCPFIVVNLGSLPTLWLDAVDRMDERSETAEIPRLPDRNQG